ncbi:MAG: hypothetical protein QXQ19_00485 [Candidatus Aenigmatarchaeota archaeon]
MALRTVALRSTARRGQANLWGVILSIMFVIIGVVVIGVLVSSLSQYIPTSGPLSNAVSIAETAIVIAAVALILYVFMGAFGGFRR